MRQIMLFTASTALLVLTACQTTGTGPAGGTARTARIDAAIERATQKTASPQTASLASLERAYKRNSEDADTAIAYGEALREAGRLQRSAIVLAPFADNGQKYPQAKIEYAATQAAMGNYAEAEDYARIAAKITPENGEALHVLGVALDAQGFHEPAENALRGALEHWEGDPAPVLNNLGLNLAAQGYIDEALYTLRRAAETAPNRTEIERNLRIVSALQPKGHMNSAGDNHAAPKPGRKPDRS